MALSRHSLRCVLYYERVSLFLLRFNAFFVALRHVPDAIRRDQAINVQYAFGVINLMLKNASQQARGADAPALPAPVQPPDDNRCLLYTSDAADE